MSDKLKERALALQREKEAALKRELEVKAERERQLAQDADERRKKHEAAAKEARRLELVRANAALNKAPAPAPIPAASMAYDPFADDAVVPRSPAAKLAARVPSKAGPSSAPHAKTARVPSARGGPSSASAAGAPRERRPRASVSPPPLGRKEKAARAFAAATAKAGTEASLFSVRALVAAREPGPARPAASSAHPARVPSGTTRAPASAAAGLSRASLPKMGKTMRGRPGEETLRKLCPDRASRDNRSLDEIQRDIRAGKAGGAGAAGSAGGPGSSQRPVDRSGAPRQATRPRSPPRRLPDTDRRAQRRRRASASDSEDDTDDSASPPPAKRRRPSPPLPPLHAADASRAEVSAVIRNLFSRGRAPPRPTYDDDSGSDMEAGLSDVEAEERRALRIARLEDERDEAEERRRKEAKDRVRRERERRG